MAERSLDEEIFFDVLQGTYYPPIIANTSFSSATTYTFTNTTNGPYWQTPKDTSWVVKIGKRSVTYIDVRPPPFSTNMMYARDVIDFLRENSGPDLSDLTDPLHICKTALLVTQLTKDSA